MRLDTHSSQVVYDRAAPRADLFSGASRKGRSLRELFVVSVFSVFLPHSVNLGLILPAFKFLRTAFHYSEISSLCFHNLTNCFFRNCFSLTTLQIAGGVTPPICNYMNQKQIAPSATLPRASSTGAGCRPVRAPNRRRSPLRTKGPCFRPLRWPLLCPERSPSACCFMNFFPAAVPGWSIMPGVLTLSWEGQPAITGSKP